MNRKAGYAFRIVLGGYLAWIGIRMIMQMVNERPSNMVFMCVMGVIFVLIGAPYAIYSLKKVWDLRQDEIGGSGESVYEEEAISVSDEEPAQNKKKDTVRNVSFHELKSVEMEKTDEMKDEPADMQDSQNDKNANGRKEENASPVRPTVIELDKNEEDTDMTKTVAEEEIESDYEEK